MIKYKTLIVLGAGASREANLPDGHGLKNIISDLLKLDFNGISNTTGDRLIFAAIKQHAIAHNKGDLEKYLTAAVSVSDGMPLATSIDNYIDDHNENIYIGLCGKLAIVRSILSAESNSLLFVNRTNRKNKPDFHALTNTWYTNFFQIIKEKCRAQDLKERLSKFCIVIFNYDRCFEQFLYHALIEYYKISETEAADLVNGMSIYHPYGTVGFLPWQKNEPSVEFGADVSPGKLLALSGKILTFTEGTNANKSAIAAIRERTSESNMFVFLGFAFHNLNLDLLFPNNWQMDYSAKHCFATVLGMSDSDKDVIRKKLSGAIEIDDNSIQLSDSTCKDFFRAYFRTLSLE